MASEGARVVVASRSRAGGREVTAWVARETGAEVVVIPTDVGAAD